MKKINRMKVALIKLQTPLQDIICTMSLKKIVNTLLHCDYPINYFNLQNLIILEKCFVNFPPRVLKRGKRSRSFYIYILHHASRQRNGVHPHILRA